MSNRWISHSQDFFILSCDWTEQFTTENLHIIEKNYLLYPYKNRWNCNCHVVHDNDTGKNLEFINYQFLRTNYENLVQKIIKEFYNNNSFFLSDIWYNYYKQSQFQEPHTHDSTLTAVHFLLYNKNIHPPLQFTEEKLNQIIPEVEQGSILIFPGQYEHYVRPNNYNDARLTIAFGITINDIR
jgi:hypothetical protein